MSAGTERMILPELGAAEQLIWSGRPRRGIRLTAPDRYLIPFSLAWCGFAVFWEWNVLRRGAQTFFALWGLMFVAVGLYFVFGRFVADAIRRGTTYYGLTSRRVIIVSGVFTRTTKFIDLASLSEISIAERPDRSGTISFDASPVPRLRFAGVETRSWPGFGQYLPPAFEMIDDAREVFAEVCVARNEVARV